MLLNRGATATTIHVAWAELGMPHPPYYGPMNVTDAWTGNSTVVPCYERGCDGAGWGGLVAPHSAVALTIRPVPKQP